MSARLVDRLKKLLAPGREEYSSNERPEFELKSRDFDMPLPEEYDLYHLDPLSKRKMTICNLYMNHQKSIQKIAELFEISRRFVIETLLEKNLIKDRRQRNISVQEDRRQK